MKAVRAIYDNGEIKLLEKRPKGRYETVILFLRMLPEDELEDIILAKRLGLEKDYENAVKLLEQGKLTKADQIRKRLEESSVGV